MNDPAMDESLLQKYFPEITPAQLQAFHRLNELYPEWNEKINVVSRKDIGQLMLHHVLHSLSIAKAITFLPGARVIDVGTGGGFPGIPLAIFFPEASFTLVDSIGKKIRVVNEISAALGLKNVATLQTRAEDFQGKFDFVVSRAVAPVSRLVSMTRHLIEPGGSHALRNGWLFLKGGDLELEIAASGRKAQIFNINDYFSEEYFREKYVIYLRM